MQLHLKMIVTTLLFLLVTALVVVVLTMTSSYKYNDVTITGAGVLEEQLLEDTSLEDDYFIFTQGIVLENKLEKFSYLTSYTYERTLPNVITIEVTTSLPIACTSELLLFESNAIPRTNTVDVLCEDAITIQNPVEEMQLISALLSLDQSIINDITKITFLDSGSVQVLIEESIVNIYVVDLEWLNHYKEFETSDETIELRKNYA